MFQYCYIALGSLQNIDDWYKEAKEDAVIPAYVGNIYQLKLNIANGIFKFNQ